MRSLRWLNSSSTNALRVLKVGSQSKLRKLQLRHYDPKTQLRVRASEVHVPAFPVVDAHAHVGRWFTGPAWAVADVPAFVDQLESAGVRRVFNFDGRWGEELEANLDRYDRVYPARFATFCHVNWQLLLTADADDRLAASVASSLQAGARGVKIWKDLGLTIRDSAGRLVMPDDPRLVGIWETAARLDVPIAIHTADPAAFFSPVDRYNERLEELLAHPEWSYFGPQFPAFHELVERLEALVGGNPRTTFIGLHAGCYAEDLQWVDRMLATYSNFFIDIAARIAELGRQPRATRQLMLAHPDRVLFGTDGIPPHRDLYQIYFRFLQSADEHFPYSWESPPPTGRWPISGVDLPPELLQAVYGGNADRLVPSVAG